MHDALAALLEASPGSGPPGSPNLSPRPPVHASTFGSLRFVFRRGQVIERLQAHHLEEPHRRAVQLRLPRARAATHLEDEVAQLEVAQHAFAADTAHLLDSRAGHRLLVSDDRQRFVRRLREAAGNLGPQSAAHCGGVLRSRGEMDLVVVAHEHHAATLERLAQLLEGAFDAVAVAVRRLLQLSNFQRTVGAEEDRFQRGRDTRGPHELRGFAVSSRGPPRQAAGSRISTWIGPNRSFCRTRISERRISSSTATNVTTASRRSSDSRISSMSSSGPCRTRSVMRSSFSCSVQVRPCTTSGRGGMRASTLLKAATRKSTSSGASWPPASTGRAGGGNANDSCCARSSSSPAISL